MDHFTQLEAMKQIKVESKSTETIKRDGFNFTRTIEPKPILFIHVPRREDENFDAVSAEIERQLNEAGWFLLWAVSNKDEYEIQAFTLKDSQEVQVQELKEIILNEIKGK